MKLANRLEIRRVLVQKDGSARIECEDAIAINRATGRIAVSDGATEGFCTGIWARLLARGWAAGSDLESVGADLSSLKSQLGELLTARWRKLAADPETPWYITPKATQGAFAAFLGLQIRATGEWRAVAIGDACLVVHRARGGWPTTFPIRQVNCFSTRPVLLASNPSLGSQSDLIEEVRGQARAGDVFLLMTDAIAAWYFRECLYDRLSRREFLNELATKESFLEFLEVQRERREIANDDVAVVQVIFRG